ncbi:MAG: DUF3795 domain-containing protein [Candidatus Paceibacterota bacterium]
MKSNLIAPCGMNCALCMAYLREKNRCLGCGDEAIGACQKCVIKNCDILKKNKRRFCSGKCEKYPCKRLKYLNKRYKTKYGMSMIDNLEFIKNNGIKVFLKKEEEKWTCKKCGGTICVHRGFCLNCGNKN